MRVAVIGGGMAGLAAAHALAGRGADPIVFEAETRAGGKVGSRSDDGWLTEDGPHFLARPLDALIEAAGLQGEVVHPQGPRTRFVHLDGRVFKAPGLGLLLRAGVGRALLEPLFARRLRDDLTLRDFLVRRFGRRAGALAAQLMAAGVYAGDPAALSARDAFPSLAAPGSILLNALRSPLRTGLWSLRRGLGSLPESIAAKLAVRLGMPVKALQPSRGAWQVLAGGATERFDAVVVAVPAPQAAALARGFAPRLADALGGFRAAPVALVHLGFQQAGLPRGFGMLDADGALHATGTLFPASMLPGRAPEGHALLSAVCGGARHPERARLPDAALVAAVCADLSRALGVKGDPEFVRIVRHAEAIPQYTLGHSARVRAARELLAGLPPIKLAGAAYDGVSVPDVVRSGTAAAEALIQ